MTKAVTPKVDGPAELPGSGDQSTALVTAVHRADLHESGISDAVIDSGRLGSLPEGIGFVWDDGTVRAPVVMFDRDKRPVDRKGKPMKARFPSRDEGGSELGPNVLRLSPEHEKTAVVEGQRQSLAFLSHAPAGWNVVGINGVRGVHPGNVARCTWAAGQSIVVLPDADVHTNPDVRRGADETAALLRRAGATSVAIAPAPGIGRDGIDDVLARTVESKRTALLADVLAQAQRVETDVAPRTQAILDAALDASELDSLPEPVALIPGVLNVAEYVLLSGKFGTYKSFVALRWAFCVATGWPWSQNSEPTTPRPVIYVAAEGVSGIRKRLRALERASGIKAAGMLTVVTRPVRLAVPEEIEGLRLIAKRVEPALIVLDTWHRMTPGIEENSATETAVPMDAALSLRDDFGATVAVVHHTGHKQKHARGSSALEDDADAAWLIALGGSEDEEDRGPGTPRTLEQRKSKDGELAQPARLMLDVDEFGDATVSVDPFAPAVVRGRRGRPSDAGREGAVTAIVHALDAADLPVSISYRAALSWCSEDGRGLARVTESLVREATKRRRERVGGVGEDSAGARWTPRGGSTAPQSQLECGSSAVGMAPQLSPAETSSAATAAASREGLPTAGPEPGAVAGLPTAPGHRIADLIRTTLAGSRPAPVDTCPDCGTPREPVPPLNFWRSCRECAPATFKNRGVAS